MLPFERLFDLVPFERPTIQLDYIFTMPSDYSVVTRPIIIGLVQFQQ